MNVGDCVKVIVIIIVIMIFCLTGYFPILLELTHWNAISNIQYSIDNLMIGSGIDML